MGTAIQILIPFTAFLFPALFGVLAMYMGEMKQNKRTAMWLVFGILLSGIYALTATEVEKTTARFGEEARHRSIIDGLEDQKRRLSIPSAVTVVMSYERFDGAPFIQDTSKWSIELGVFDTDQNVRNGKPIATMVPTTTVDAIEGTNMHNPFTSGDEIRVVFNNFVGDYREVIQGDAWNGVWIDIVVPNAVARYWEVPHSDYWRDTAGGMVFELAGQELGRHYAQQAGSSGDAQGIHGQMGYDEAARVIPYRLTFEVFIDGVKAGQTQGLMCFIEGERHFRESVRTWSPIHVSPEFFKMDVSNEFSLSSKRPRVWGYASLLILGVGCITIIIVVAKRVFGSSKH